MPTYPSEEDGNVAMAAGFNKIYQNLGLGAQCSPNHESQAFACILGELAHCQANGNYATEGCPRGQSCYALPKPSGQSGVVVQCAIPSDAAKALAAESPSSTSNIMKIPSTSITESSDAQAPKDNLGFTGHLAQTVSVQSAASIASSTPTASQSAVTKQTSTMASQAKNEVVLTSQAAQVSSAESSFEPTPISPSVLAEASSPPIIAVTATAVQTQGHSPVQEPTRSGAVLPAASVVAGNGNPIVSFPSALPSPDDQVRPNQNNALQLVASTRAPQASLFKAQETISEIGNPATTEPALSSTPSTADGAGVSIVPLGVPVMEKMDVENGQATVTVTVTVTTTERAPPITITIAP